ncbi:hypothetical protein IF1G_00375 [Cordyceps javanica]|uniref:Uncharacterized protein n=1 Tax=Cordyceps javanica TaxID=43265 RepID=A0A545VFE3_9HYPO|nr:hypothetical protein IF1G_00375 [Cordyceps javanica]
MGGVRCTGYGWLTSVTVPMAQTRGKRRAMAEEVTRPKRRRQGVTDKASCRIETRSSGRRRAGARRGECISHRPSCEEENEGDDGMGDAK